MMKKVRSIIFPVLLLFSCNENDNLPRVETTTSGSKWTLRIGSPAADVYSQLQELGIEKNFTEVSLVYRKPFSKPEEVRDHLPFYRAITLQSNTGRIERVLFQFDQDKVSSIEAGGGMVAEVYQWPLDAPDEISIHSNDPIDVFYAKLLAIYQMPGYGSYQIILPDKSLEKPFDPDMANHNEWRFSFSEKIKPGKNGRSSVALYFSKGKLNKIRHEYDESSTVNN
jgi:hypothetical protein